MILQAPFGIPPVTVAAGIGTQTVTDDFNRTNEAPLAGNWTQDSVRFYLTSNQVVNGGTPTLDAWGFYNIWASGDDQYSQIKVTVVGTGAGSGPGVIVRKAAGATATFYRLVMDANGAFELGKFVAPSSFSSLRTGSIGTYVAGTQLGLSASGGATTTLKIWYGGVQIGTNVTDSSSPITTGSPGIGYSAEITSYILDDWDAGTVP